MANQVLRIESRSTSLGGGEAAHILGRTRPDNARQREGLPAVDVLINDVRRAKARWRAAKKERGKTRGRPPKPALSILMAGPPPIDGPDAWDKAKVDEWAAKSLEWFRGICPHAPISAAAVHWDERSPHLHIECAPIDRADDGSVRLGMGHLMRRIAASAPPTDKHAKGQFRDTMSRCQDAYQHAVGQHYDLERGRKLAQKPGRHRAVDPELGAELRAADIEARARADAADAARVAKRMRAEAARAEKDRDRALRAQHRVREWLERAGVAVGK